METSSKITQISILAVIELKEQKAENNILLAQEQTWISGEIVPENPIKILKNQKPAETVKIKQIKPHKNLQITNVW